MLNTESMRTGPATLLLTALSMLGIAGNPALLAQSPARIDVSKLGPQVGDRVPDFSLKDQNGNTQNLRSIMGPKGVMLVFLRSANW
jgi:hypothetical protein